MKMENEKKIRVLIAEDYYFTQKLIASIIENHGFTVVDFAENGLDAVKKYKELKPDIVTMDMNMPDLNGLQALTEILTYDPQAKVIAITGYDRVEAKAREIGAVDFLLKPFHPETLISKMQNAVGITSKPVENRIDKFDMNIFKKPVIPETVNPWDEHQATEEPVQVPEVDINKLYMMMEGEDEDSFEIIPSIEESSKPDFSSLFLKTAIEPVEENDNTPIIRLTPLPVIPILTEEDEIMAPVMSKTAPVSIVSDEEDDEDDLLGSFVRHRPVNNPPIVEVLNELEIKTEETVQGKEIRILPEEIEERLKKLSIFESKAGETIEQEVEDDDDFTLLSEPDPEYYPPYNPYIDEPLVIKPPMDLDAGTSDYFELSTWDSYREEIGKEKERVSLFKKIRNKIKK